MGHTSVKYLQGEKVYLRPAEESDVELLYGGINNVSESRKLRGIQRPASRAEVESAIHSQGDTAWTGFIICLQENNEAIGDLALHGMNNTINRNATMRVVIHNEAYLGGGYGTEAIQLLLDFGFGNLNLHRIELDVFTHNERAIRSYEKLGFQKEGIKRENWFLNHRYHDSVIMSMLEHEYRKKWAHKLMKNEQL